MAVENWMQFGTFAEQEEFVYPTPDTYAGIVINGNMVAHTPSAMAGFLLEKIPHETKFIIDPFTHAFQHSPTFITGKTGEVKSSIAKLAEKFSSPIIEILGSRALDHTDFNEKNIGEYTERVLEFQRCFLHDYMEDSDVAKYLDDDEKLKEPYALIAPYFYLTEINYKSWAKLTVDLLRAAKEIRDKKNLKPKLFCNIVLNKGLLQLDNLNTIIDELKVIGPDGFIVWVDDFDETTASLAELSALRNFFKLLRKNSHAEIINLHGGYFSILNGATDFGGLVTGVCHGPEYGESRAVVPVGGGIPTSKYYVPDIHSREKYRDCLLWFNKAGWLNDAHTFHANVCMCPLCKKILDGNVDNFIKFGGEGSVKTIQRGRSVVNLQFPTREEKLNCLRHYLHTKKSEYLKASTNSRPDLLSDLQDSIDKYIPVTGIEYISHLVRWKAVLSEI